MENLNLNKLRILFVSVLLVLALTIPAAAQRATATPTPNAPESTPEPAETEEPITLDLRALDEAGFTKEGLLELLLEAELIRDGGDFIFDESFITTGFDGTTVLREDSVSNYKNSAGGALLSFRPADEIAVCGFLTHGLADGAGIKQVILIGVTFFDSIIVGIQSEAIDGGRVQHEFELPEDVNFYNPNNLTYTLMDDHLTIFINGEAILQNFELGVFVADDAEEEGEPQEALFGAVLGMSCVMTEAWIYTFE